MTPEGINITRARYIAAHRRNQPLAELERKAKKAASRSGFTMEDLDLAFARGMLRFIAVAERILERLGEEHEHNGPLRAIRSRVEV